MMKSSGSILKKHNKHNTSIATIIPIVVAILVPDELELGVGRLGHFDPHVGSVYLPPLVITQSYPLQSYVS